MKRDLSESDFAGWELQAQRNRFAESVFAKLDEHPCSAVGSAAMTIGAFLLWIAAPAIVFFAWVLK